MGVIALAARRDSVRITEAMLDAGEQAFADVIGPHELDGYTLRLMLNAVYLAMKKAAANGRG